MNGNELITAEVIEQEVQLVTELLHGSELEGCQNLIRAARECIDAQIALGIERVRLGQTQVAYTQQHRELVQLQESDRSQRSALQNFQTSFDQIRTVLGLRATGRFDVLSMTGEVVRERDKYKELYTTAAAAAKQEVWYWQGDASDHLESLTCPVIIRAEAMRELVAERDKYYHLLYTPEIQDFVTAVKLETAHQRDRWGSDYDLGKKASDWFWLVGYLAGKALSAAITGNLDKAKHHCISTAAACCNWHAALSGTYTNMQPGHTPSITRATAVDERREA